MTQWHFEWLKMRRNNWLKVFIVVLAVSLTVTFGLTYQQVSHIREQTKEEIAKEKASYNNLEDTLETMPFTATEKTQLLAMRDQVMPLLEQQLTSIDQGNNADFMSAKLAYYPLKTDFWSLFNQQPAGLTGKENEESYYITALQTAKQPYEDQTVSLNPMNYLYSILRLVTKSYVLPAILILYYAVFLLEKETGTIHFALIFSPSKKRYLAVNMAVTFCLVLLFLLVFLAGSYCLAHYFGLPFFVSQGWQLDRVVDSSYLLQTIVTFKTVLITTLPLLLGLALLYQQLFYLCTLLFSKMIFEVLAYLLLTIGGGFGLSYLTVVGNPFRLLQLKSFLYNEPTLVDLGLSLSLLLLLSAIIHRFVQKALARGVVS